jgi:hypothetical protein
MAFPGMKKAKDLKVTAPHDWRTTDEDEINRRRLRAQTEAMKVTNTDARHPVLEALAAV